jgi:hypothetical protein
VGRMSEEEWTAKTQWARRGAKFENIVYIRGRIRLQM